jgi:NADH-quinone oxidoreductase subunit H
MIAASAMMVTLFLGGWTLPVAGLNRPAESIPMGVAHIVIFMAKVAVLMGLFIWVRWMWPRFRYDQLMDLGWRRFLPLSLVNIIGTALVLWMVA